MKHEQHTPQDELLARYFAGETGTEENASVETWIAASAENRAYFDTMKRTWDFSGKAASASFDTDAAWRKMQARMQPAKTSRRRYAAAAAVVFILFSAAAAYRTIRSEADVRQLTLSSGTKSTQHTLPDGSIAGLNRDSRIEYYSGGSSDFREVTLSGEAFFEVQRDASKPFVVHTGGLDVRVLGTSFNVRAYPDADSVEVLVHTGRVSCIAGRDTVVIGPGESAVYSRSTKTLRKPAASDPNTMSWRTRIFKFSGTPLSAVVQKLNEVYGASIVLKNPELAGCPLTTNFYDRPIDDIVEVIGATFDLTVERKGDTILLDGEGCP